MDMPLATRVRELLDAGGGEPLESGRFLPVATLASGARLGLDASASWILVPEGGGPIRAYAAEHAHIFYEVLESRRDEFDDAIEAAARAAGLPPDEVVFSFPAIAVVRAVLTKSFPYLTRLALLWIRNTELRELRADLIAVSRSGDMPVPIRDLAERLIVPE
jgi:hypothetical protein